MNQGDQEPSGIGAEAGRLFRAREPQDRHPGAAGRWLARFVNGLGIGREIDVLGDRDGLAGRRAGRHISDRDHQVLDRLDFVTLVYARRQAREQRAEMNAGRDAWFDHGQFLGQGGVRAGLPGGVSPLEDASYRDTGGLRAASRAA